MFHKHVRSGVAFPNPASYNGWEEWCLTCNEKLINDYTGKWFSTGVRSGSRPIMDAERQSDTVVNNTRGDV